MAIRPARQSRRCARGNPRRFEQGDRTEPFGQNPQIRRKVPSANCQQSPDSIPWLAGPGLTSRPASQLLATDLQQPVPGQPRHVCGPTKVDLSAAGFLATVPPRLLLLGAPPSRSREGCSICPGSKSTFRPALRSGSLTAARRCWCITSRSKQVCWPLACARSPACFRTWIAVPGRPLRESVTFGAAVVPMLLIDRFKHMGMSQRRHGADGRT